MAQRLPSDRNNLPASNLVWVPARGRGFFTFPLSSPPRFFSVPPKQPLLAGGAATVSAPRRTSPRGFSDIRGGVARGFVGR